MLTSLYYILTEISMKINNMSNVNGKWQMEEEMWHSGNLHETEWDPAGHSQLDKYTWRLSQGS